MIRSRRGRRILLSLALQPFCIVPTFTDSQIVPLGRLCGYDLGVGYVPLDGPQCGNCTRDICAQRDDETAAYRDLYRRNYRTREPARDYPLHSAAALSNIGCFHDCEDRRCARTREARAVRGQARIGEYTVLKQPSDRARTLPASVVSRADAHALDGGNIHVLLSSAGSWWIHGTRR